MLIAAQYHANLNHFDEAVNAYEIYLAAYPDDFGARASFAYLLMMNDRPGEALRHFKEVVRVSPSDGSAFINLATSCLKLGRPAEALPYYEKAFALERAWLTIRNLNHEYGFALVRGGEPAKAHEVFALMLNVPRPGERGSGSRSLALLEMYGGRHRKAKVLLVEALALTTIDYWPRARNHLFMSILLQSQGDRHGAVVALDQAVRALKNLGEPVVETPARVGAMYARSGAADKAARVLAETSPKVDRQNAQARAELHLLEGEIALARGEYARAIQVFALAHQEAKNELALAALAGCMTGPEIWIRRSPARKASSRTPTRQVGNPSRTGWKPTRGSLNSTWLARTR